MYTRQQVLDWINEQRENVNAAPLTTLIKGVPEEWDNCPVANTFDENNPYVMDVEVFPETKADANGKSYLVRVEDSDFPWGFMSWDTDKVALPLFVTEFTKDFDNGELPDLILER